ncbi:DUF2795 domain-containing protein [Actinopolyspora erythraea]|uniref:DUF2795 domain-containing protein n=1 Tax=Actinopolyspora erythraea TaxID=414996 RepID=A0A099D616_9ACTN|nr:DUF2795 domain-containing protein [Actinopolyspora erythraea]ASU78571.1 DUF2795 domain-containing protein [Actinopolyspora erythraea]KGI81573.1 hypothetical protein IL38_10085 [Actinopolyspora erythraea]
MTDADERRVNKALQGLEFPADKAELIRYAEDREADPRTLRALRALPEGTYQDGGEVERCVPQRPEEAPGR